MGSAFDDIAQMLHAVLKNVDICANHRFGYVLLNCWACWQQYAENSKIDSLEQTLTVSVVSSCAAEKGAELHPRGAAKRGVPHERH